MQAFQNVDEKRTNDEREKEKRNEGISIELGRVRKCAPADL